MTNKIVQDLTNKLIEWVLSQVEVKCLPF